jgi:hypothetical protein
MKITIRSGIVGMMVLIVSIIFANVQLAQSAARVGMGDVHVVEQNDLEDARETYASCKEYCRKHYGEIPPSLLPSSNFQENSNNSPVAKVDPPTEEEPVDVWPYEEDFNLEAHEEVAYIMAMYQQCMERCEKKFRMENTENIDYILK